MKAARRCFSIRRGQCPQCRKTYRGSIQNFPKALYGHRLVSQAVVMHYLQGISIGRILELLGSEVTHGALINIFHRVGDLCGKARTGLIEQLRKDEVRNADETGWRTNGCAGYAWIFRSERVTIFEHCNSRASKIPLNILGPQNLNGYLVVDRYSAYNKVPVKIQYCYAHLLREVGKLEKEFGGNEEVERFAKRMCSHLSEAMTLQTMAFTKEQYMVRADGIKQAIVKEVNYTYEHLGIRHIQQIFTKNKNRMYHWAENPKVPADNNRAEREIRSTVIARKTSFGSQSDRGAKTRSDIMSVLFTVKKRLKGQPVEEWLSQALNHLTQNPKLQIFDLIPPFPR